MIHSGSTPAASPLASGAASRPAAGACRAGRRLRLVEVLHVECRAPLLEDQSLPPSRRCRVSPRSAEPVRRGPGRRSAGASRGTHQPPRRRPRGTVPHPGGATQEFVGGRGDQPLARDVRRRSRRVGHRRSLALPCVVSAPAVIRSTGVIVRRWRTMALVAAPSRTPATRALSGVTWPSAGGAAEKLPINLSRPDLSRKIRADRVVRRAVPLPGGPFPEHETDDDRLAGRGAAVRSMDVAADIGRLRRCRAPVRVQPAGCRCHTRSRRSASYCVAARWPSNRTEVGDVDLLDEHGGLSVGCRWRRATPQWCSRRMDNASGAPDDPRNRQVLLRDEFELGTQHHLPVPVDQALPHLAHQDQRRIGQLAHLQQLPHHHQLQYRADAAGHDDECVRDLDEVVKARKEARCSNARRQRVDILLERPMDSDPDGPDLTVRGRRAPRLRWPLASARERRR